MLRYVFLNENQKLELRTGGTPPDGAFALTSDEYAELAAGGALASAAFQVWLEAHPPLPPEPLPSGVLHASCTPWQIRKALNALGLRQAVEDAVAASNDITLKDGWEFATEFRSDDPFVLSMGATLGKNADETRELIAYASTL